MDIFVSTIHTSNLVQLNQGLVVKKFFCMASLRNVPISPIFKNPSAKLLSPVETARVHHKAAAPSNVSHVWRGQLLKRNTECTGYSSKVFLGGVSSVMKISHFVQALKRFGNIYDKWSRNESGGYAYVRFRSDGRVKALLNCCAHDITNVFMKQ